MLSLKEIEQLMLPNFVFNKEQGSHRLETAPKIESGKNIALVVFVGVAYFAGYKGKEIIAHLEINKGKFTSLFAKFIQAYNEYNAVALSLLYQNQDENKRIMAKFNLVSNAMKINTPTDTYLTMADFNF